MKEIIKACLWFWGVLFAFASDVARYIHWDKTGIVFGGVSVGIFAVMVWFYIWGHNRVKDQTGA